MTESKKDYIDVGNPRDKSIVQRFKKALDDEEQKNVKEHKPFDYYNAKRDYQDKIDELLKNAERTPGFKGDIELPALDFSKYADPQRFKLLATEPIYENIILEGTRQKVLTAYNLEYVVPSRGNRITVWIPVNVYNERFGKGASSKK